ncbi:hypothetical protein AAEX63_10685 [Luteococcus sp. H138]|uniref:hypothetical protein n=1 Tax=unclassified Luteococcus TaxID=2639923 RepID=UPI00313C2256
MVAKKPPLKIPKTAGEAATLLLQQALHAAKDPKAVAAFAAAAATNPTVAAAVKAIRGKAHGQVTGPVSDQVEKQILLVQEAMRSYATMPDVDAPVQEWNRRISLLRHKAPLVDGLVGKDHQRAAKELLKESNSLILDVANFGLDGESAAAAQPKKKLPGLTLKKKTTSAS